MRDKKKTADHSTRHRSQTSSTGNCFDPSPIVQEILRTFEPRSWSDLVGDYDIEAHLRELNEQGYTQAWENRPFELYICREHRTWNRTPKDCPLCIRDENLKVGQDLFGEFYL